MNFQDTHASLPINRAEDHKRARLKLEQGVRLALEARHRADQEHTQIEAEEEARFVEEAKLKAEEEDQAQIWDDEEAYLTK